MSIASIVKSEAGGRFQNKDWYRQTLAKVLNNYQGEEYDSPGELDEVSGSFQAGETYFFNYVATKPLKLKYYDQYPLTYIIDIFGDGFLGANLHYIPPRVRLGIAGSLLNNADGIVVPNKTLHKYYFRGVQGTVMRVPEKEMPEVSVLPTDKFVYPDGRDFPTRRVWGNL